MDQLNQSRWRDRNRDGDGDGEDWCKYEEVSKDYWGSTVLGTCSNTSKRPRTGLKWRVILYTALALGLFAWTALVISEVCS